MSLDVPCWSSMRGGWPSDCARQVPHLGGGRVGHYWPAFSIGELTDDELIAAAEARTSMSHPYHEMEMQRRLKHAPLAQIAESRKGRIWGGWVRR
jgi:hypothetical protein